MKIRAFKSIKNRLTFWFLTIALLPLLLALGITYLQRVDVIENQTFDKLRAIRQLKVARLHDWLKIRTDDMLAISSGDQFEGMEGFTSPSSEEHEKIISSMRGNMQRYLENHSAYNQIDVLNPMNGKVMISTKAHFEGDDYFNEDLFKAPMKSRSLFLMDIHYSNIHREISMIYSTPIFCKMHHGEHIVAILTAHVDLDNSLYKMLGDREGLGETGETLIVNRDAMALNELRWRSGAPLRLQISAEPAVLAAQGNTGITETTDYRGEAILAAYTHIPETGWGFVCKQDLYELNKPIREMILNFILLFIVSTIFIYIVALLVGKNIASPVIRMDKLALGIQAGNYSLRNIEASEDEMGSLAESINKLAASIELKDLIQSGITDISETMIGISTMHEFGENVLKQMIQITEAQMGAFYILDELTSEFVHHSSIGANQEMMKPFKADFAEGEIGTPILLKNISYLKEIPADTVFTFRTTAGEAIPKEIITIPILMDELAVAVISIVNIKPFYHGCVDIVENSWRSINASYSSIVSNERTRVLAKTLAKTNDQLEKQAEVLKDTTKDLRDKNQELESLAEEFKSQADELQEQNIELDEQRKQVEGANRLKSQFLSNMSHELRTPLNSILSLSNVLRRQSKDKMSDDQQNYLGIIERNGKQLLDLINNILDLSKIESGQMELSLSSVSITSIITDIAESMRPLAQDKGIGLILALDDEIQTIITDEFLIYRIIQNILSNAIKFTEKGEIHIQLTSQKGEISLAVKDTGVGISAKNVGLIFDEFRQVDGSTTRRFEGTGLGLSIAKRSAVLLGGDLQVKSVENIGSTLTLTLPQEHPQHILTIAGPHHLGLSEDEEVRMKADHPPVTMNLLIVEDQESAVLLISAFLEQHGFKSDVARGGQEAIDYCLAIIPDGIILDLMMPEVDGFDFLEILRSNPSTSKIPVLVLTAKDLTKKDRDRLTKYGVQQLIQKGDIDENQFIQKVKLMMNLSGKPAQLASESIALALPKKKRKSGKTKLKNPTILIIEDNPDSLISLKALLPDTCLVLEATDGAAGLEMAQSHKPNLILMDIMLPVMDGIQVLKAIKSDQNLGNISVIAVTAKAMKGDKEALIAGGFDDYLSKPIDAAKLMQLLNQFLTEK